MDHLQLNLAAAAAELGVQLVRTGPRAHDGLAVRDRKCESSILTQ